MFGLGKLAVLESKLDIYEDLSKEMLDKLERAVSTISENSNRVSVILERHETRLDESERTDNLIIKMIEEVKDQEEKNHKILHERIDRIQKESRLQSEVCNWCRCCASNARSSGTDRISRLQNLDSDPPKEYDRD